MSGTGSCVVSARDIQLERWRVELCLLISSVNGCLLCQNRRISLQKYFKMESFNSRVRTITVAQEDWLWDLEWTIHKVCEKYLVFLWSFIKRTKEERCQNNSKKINANPINSFLTCWCYFSTHQRNRKKNPFFPHICPCPKHGLSFTLFSAIQI